jgi:hypothetical protein
MRALAALFALAVPLIATPSASAAAARSAGAGDAGFAPAGGNSGSVGSGSSPSPCSDGKYNFLAAGAHWQQSLNWSFRASSVPAGLSTSGALAAIKRGFANVTTARNDCGRADNVGATSKYLGTTTRRPAVTSNGSCGARDGHNVVGFAPLGGYYAGYTCIWWDGGKIVEADMRLDSGTSWALSSTGCSNGLMMEALVTHEAGHAFGLAHVAESKHGRLTMSVYIDALCENQESTLGLGDLRGLEALY